MVVIEEVDDDEEETTTDTRALPKETGEETTSKPAKKVGFYVFFHLNFFITDSVG